MAQIKVDIERVHGQISGNFFGFFTEHLSRILYNGIFEPDSPHCDEYGYRTDVMDAVKLFRPATLRWPGGNFASAYNWMNGVGDASKRRVVFDPVWKSKEPNSFGTDEFVKYCRLVGAEPYICINVGDGTQREAMQWVEYCNSVAGTEVADMRARNGSVEPYGVKLWGLGNELCGDWQIGHKSAVNYAATALEYGKAMRAIDPDIKLVAAGGIHMRMGFEHIERNWDRIVLEKLAGMIDYVGLHFYARKLPVSQDEKIRYFQHISEPEWLEKNITILKGEIDKAKYHSRGKEQREIRIAVDELGVCVQPETPADLQDALVAACLMNTLVNKADVVDFCSYTSIANVFSPFFTRKESMFLQTVYYTLVAYSRYASGHALKLHVECPTFTSDMIGDLPLLHSSAIYDDEKGMVTLFVVNRDPSDVIISDIACQNGIWSSIAEVYEVNGQSLSSQNTFDNTQNVKSVSRDIQTGEQSVFTYAFPSHSFTTLRMQIKDNT